MHRTPSTLPDASRRWAACVSRKAGQSILESFGIMILLCLILFGVVQYVLMLTAQEVVQYGADASIRARTVGFNRFMVWKVSRVATIANAGRMEFPAGIPAGDWDAWQQQNTGAAFRSAVASSPRSRQYGEIEQYTIPLYLGGEHPATLPGVLDYADWDTVGGPVYLGTPGETIGARINQDYPLRMPFLRAFSDNDEIPLRGEAWLADHAELYLE